MTYFFNIYIFEQKLSNLLAAGNRVTDLARAYEADKIEGEELSLTVNTIGQITDSRIYVLMDKKKLTDLRSLDDSKLVDIDESQIVNDILQVLDGKTLYRKKQFSSQMNTYVVFVGIPVHIDGIVDGVILIYSPLDQVNKTLLRVHKIIWGTAAVSLALAAIIILVISRRISKPIETMQKAASSIAEGGFTDDVEVTGRDEIAKLTGTFNYMKNRLQQVEEMRKDFIANVSHELRTPLPPFEVLSKVL